MNADDPRRPVAFRIERTGPGSFVAVTIDRWGRDLDRQEVCACADQAASGATHHGQRPLAYAGMTSGRLRQPVDDRACPVKPSHWTWQDHAPHCHGALDACAPAGPFATHPGAPQ